MKSQRNNKVGFLMDSMEFNKVFAAILVAGIIASLSGFLAEELMHPHKLEKNAYSIEGVEDTGSGGNIKVAMAEPVLDMIAEADIERGKKLSRACAACHTFDKGGTNGLGPNLWNTVMQEKAHSSTFDYSPSMQAKEGRWTYLDMNKFLWKPKKFVEGTKMNFIGLKKPEDRAAVIAWLRTLSDNPAPLPSPVDINAEQAALSPPEE